jgi:hypothetical protein
MSRWTSCGPWWCKTHHNISKEVLLAQLEGLCKGVCEDLFNLSTKLDPQQEASGFIATFANSRRAVGKCVKDFMVSLPPSKRFDAIMVVVDRFSKMAHFIPTKDEATAQEMGRLFFSHIFKHHGLPKDIVLDRDPKFTSKFWRALWKRMGSELKMSTSFRPQIDGQTERVNLVIQQFLRNYVAAD